MKKAFVVILTFVFIVSVNLIFDSEEATSVSSQNTVTPKVIIDAGHGGFDGGATAIDGTLEKDINLKIALKLAFFLEQSGVEVILTRNSDASTEKETAKPIASRKKDDLNQRLQLMKNNPDALFVSIHLNKFTTSAAIGSQVFYSANNENSKKLADDIQKLIVKLLQPDNKRVNKKANSSTYILHNATVPAVLVECGFLSNSTELKLLKDENYQNKMAFSIYCGIMEYFKNIKEI